MASPDEAWIDAVTAADLRLCGVEQFDDETAPEALRRLADEMGVDLARVGRCLALLRQEPCLLAGGAPMAVLAWSPRQAAFRAAYDGELGLDWTRLSIGAAGVWLALLSMEAGELPDQSEHWLVTRLRPQLSAVNPDLRELAQAYARWAVGKPGQALDDYEQRLGQAFWRCAAHRLR
ncbi:MAG TPA: hypothetical protein PKE61_14240 [Burkholderiaceae bacterium]|nr:hypothetical protein [Burkholderiaceae bacterium]HNB43983.1 hypothetical protein [Burkholderiaceae bacterium]